MPATLVLPMARDKEQSNESPIPILDERIEFRGTSYLRGMTAEALRELDSVIVLQSEGGDRLAVLIGYEEYLVLQKMAIAGKDRKL
jgi:hypothetical protein